MRGQIICGVCKSDNVYKVRGKGGYSHQQCEELVFVWHYCCLECEQTTVKEHFPESSREPFAKYQQCYCGQIVETIHILESEHDDCIENYYKKGSETSRV